VTFPHQPVFFRHKCFFALPRHGKTVPVANLYTKPVRRCYRRSNQRRAVRGFDQLSAPEQISAMFRERRKLFFKERMSGKMAGYTAVPVQNDVFFELAELFFRIFSEILSFLTFYKFFDGFQRGFRRKA
jgi:hypothetical protein